MIQGYLKRCSTLCRWPSPAVKIEYTGGESVSLTLQYLHGTLVMWSNSSLSHVVFHVRMSVSIIGLAM